MLCNRTILDHKVHVYILTNFNVVYVTEKNKTFSKTMLPSAIFFSQGLSNIRQSIVGDFMVQIRNIWLLDEIDLKTYVNFWIK